MRFLKGSKVEVWQEVEVPLGSWRPGEIVSGNGHNYYVRYNSCLVDSGADVDRVPRRAIRPCPPPLENLVCWTAGDILEVFDSYSWKVAKMVTVLGKHCYLIRLLGSSLELRAHVSDLRSRQLWQDDKWVVIQKDSARCSGGSFMSQSKGGKFGFRLGRYQQLHCAVDNHHLLKNQSVFEGDMPRGVKRKSFAVPTYLTQCSEATKRLRMSDRDGRQLALFAGDSLHLIEKVDAVDSPCLMLGEKYMHASLNKRNNGFLKTNLEGVNTNADYQYHIVTTSDPSGTDSISSSVGSCNPSSSPYRSQYNTLAYQSEDICSRTDVAEASISGRETTQHDKDFPREETHLLELHAYRATMMALYASGSISWEQEALLTNLRLTLNISIDEHLAELRNLVSSAVRSR